MATTNARNRKFDLGTIVCKEFADPPGLQCRPLSAGGGGSPGPREAEHIEALRKEDAAEEKENGCVRVDTDLGEQTEACSADESPLKAQLPPKSVKKWSKSA